MALQLSSLSRGQNTKMQNIYFYTILLQPRVRRLRLFPFIFSKNFPHNFAVFFSFNKFSVFLCAKFCSNFCIAIFSRKIGAKICGNIGGNFSDCKILRKILRKNIQCKKFRKIMRRKLSVHFVPTNI